MICDSYEIFICPDPNCERWDIEPLRCDDHHSHPLGDYPDLERLLVKPSQAAIEAYRYRAETRRFA